MATAADSTCLIIAGLCIGVTVLDGSYAKMYGEAQAAKMSIQQCIKDEAVKGFSDVVVSSNISEGICHLYAN